jgi:hypothetical protein
MIVHPSVGKPVAELLQSANPKQRFLNVFEIFSKQAGLQNLFNVFEPLAGDSKSQQTMQALIDADFDSNLLKSGSVMVLNLKSQDVCGDFRMNERIFRYTMCSEQAKGPTSTKPV